MSGLAGILAGHHDPGVYQWHAQFEVADVRHAVEHAGWRFGCVDGWVHQDRAGLIADVAESLSFKESCGEDYGALAECLREVTDKTVLLWDGWSTLARADRSDFDAAVDVFSRRAKEGEPFVVLLRGEGPEIDIPSLDS
jgi:hypothetical protein